ncbi:hypothetical protein [Yinghuangia soli]|uniref:Uncharacterized protein n=1 Tax=Yinghuangia soli TaxID=2908204 RepID=A0AA41Q3F5_9ACTN|nr:hypothetical protein [Yinghuangia soli]MCF2530843.1 hypothetical protein [Yinghuangia soli]
MTRTADAQEWLPPALLRAVWADPGHLPEVMALFAVRHLGEGAGESVRNLRTEHPDTPRAALGSGIVTRGTRTTIAEGSFVGGPFLVLIPVAFCAALLAQARMVLQLAALHGRDTRDEARAADLLVLQGAYPAHEQAAAAVAGIRTSLPAAGRRKMPRGQRIATLVRMAAILGITTPDQGPTSKLRRALVWAAIVLLVLVGMVLPFVWIPVMGWSYRKATPRLGRRAVRYYAAAPDPASTAPHVTVAGGTHRVHRVKHRGADRGSESGHVDPLGLAAVLRTLVAVVLPLAAVLFVVVADFRIGNSNLAAAGVTLVAAAQAGAAFWYIHWHRKLHRKPPRGKRWRWHRGQER